MSIADASTENLGNILYDFSIDMPVGSKVSVRFKTAVSTGKTYLNYAEQV